MGMHGEGCALSPDRSGSRMNLGCSSVHNAYRFRVRLLTSRHNAKQAHLETGDAQFDGSGCQT